MVLRRLSGKTENTTPVLTLITQFGGSKTHLALPLGQRRRCCLGVHGGDEPVEHRRPEGGSRCSGGCVRRQCLGSTPGREHPGSIWLANWPATRVSPHSPPPGRRRRAPRLWHGCSPPHSRRCCCCSMRCATSSIVIGGWPRVSTPSCKTSRSPSPAPSRAAVVSLPRSQVEMTEWDQQWRIAKVVRRVARDLIANDESEISEVVRPRLFEDLRRRDRVAHVVTLLVGEHAKRTKSLPFASKHQGMWQHHGEFVSLLRIALLD